MTRQDKIFSFFSFCVVIIFSLSTGWLSFFDYNLHHDGYAITQSLRIIQGETPYVEVFLQYGPAFHYLYGLILLFNENAFLISKFFGLILILLTCWIFFLAGEKSDRVDKAIAIAFWLLSCYWFLNYSQYFVQFHPSQLGLLLFVACYKLLVDSASKNKIPNLIAVLLPIGATVAFFVKMNFGVFLAGAVFSSLFFIQKTRHLQVWYIGVALIVIVVATWAFDVFNISVLNYLNFFKNFSSKNGFLWTLGLSTVHLDFDHGNVQPWHRLFYLVPTTVLLFAIAIKGFKSHTDILAENSRVDLLFNSPQIQICCVFAIWLWMTVFPVGAYQHIWYSSLFSIFLIIRILRAFLNGMIFSVLATLVLMHFSISTAGQFLLKINYVSNYVKADGFVAKDLFVSEKVNSILNTVHNFERRPDCSVLNLSNIAFPLKRPKVVCGVFEERSSFTWPDNWNQRFFDYKNMMLGWDKPVLSHSHYHGLNRKYVMHESNIGQDFTEDFFVFDDKVEADFVFTEGYLFGPNRFATNFLNGGPSRSPNFIQFGKDLYYNIDCNELNDVLKQIDGEIYRVNKMHNGSCDFIVEQTPLNFDEWVELVSFLHLKFKLQPNNLLEVMRSEVVGGALHVEFKGVYLPVEYNQNAVLYF